MEPKWTDEQLRAITEKECNILVAAAAGAGKTAVLVERIINKITNDNVDIDRLLVVTFTNAAAAEMRERIYLAISKKMDQNSDTKNILRQMALLEKASITTIHSFCLEVIRNNFSSIDIDPNFRIADETETTLIKTETLNELFEEEYEKASEDLINLLESYGTSKDDALIQDMVLNLYHFIQSNPWPKKWLHDMRDKMQIEKDIDFSCTVWGDVILESILLDLKGAKNNIIKAIGIIKSDDVLQDKYYDVFIEEYMLIDDMIRRIDNGQDVQRWDKLYNLISDMKFKKLPAIRSKDNFDIDKQEKVKAIRQELKDLIKKIETKLVNDKSANIIKDIEVAYPSISYLVYLVETFMDMYNEKKRKKNIVDFGDLEHYCLELLTTTDEEGNFVPSDIAKSYRDKFEEILVDEYQDSNDIQEKIISMISKEKVNCPNVFMVGDVKQSIYRFRQANPELFLEKYNNYENKSSGSYRKIQLFKNFRSRRGVISAANFVFEQIMSKDIGDLDYTKDEALNFGANFPDCSNYEVDDVAELYLIDTKKVLDSQYEQKQDTNMLDNQDLEQIDDVNSIQCEARAIGMKILSLTKSQTPYMVYDKHTGTYRGAEFRDIVILLRATKIWADTFVKELSDMGIGVFADTDTGFFKTIEILVVVSFLQIIDNPLQDIPLLAVLRSPIVGLNADELAHIRICNREVSIFEALQEFVTLDNQDKDFLDTKFKVGKFLECYKELKDMSWYMPTDELIWELYNKTGYYAMVGAMPMGEQKQANLRVLFEKARQFEETSYKGLFNFVNFIDKLRSSNGDMGSAKILGENDNVVRIMSIHKSKGLEFPIVFLAGCGKRFNLRDVTKSIIFHQKLGFGPDIVDYERRVSWPSVLKTAIGEKLRQETLSEEMRILYVAITRAREKLIITGSVNDIAKNMHKWNEMSNSKQDKIYPFEVKKGRTFLDWIVPAILKHKRGIEFFEMLPEGFLFNENLVDDVSNWEIYFVNKSDILGYNKQYKQENAIFSQKLGDLEVSDEITYIPKDILDKLNWEYKYKGLELIPAKVSVTGLLKDTNKAQEIVIKKPKFLEEEEGLEAAKRGTIIHFIMQHIDFFDNDIKAQIKNMIDKQLITEIEAKSVDIYKIKRFMDSDLGRRIKASTSVNREVPFFLNIPCQSVYKLENEQIDEDVILQGVIDCYFEEKDYLVLLDYKSDFVKDSDDVERIRQRYKDQINNYKKVLERLTNKTVKHQYIYLFSNGEIIEY